MTDLSPPSREILTPSELNARVRTLLERGFATLWIEGEISNFLRAASGHLYFTLKDANAQVRCTMWRNRAVQVRFAVVDGVRVLARARVTLYEPRGEFQLQIEHMEPAGYGALQRAFEELKQRLAAEGLFDAARKRPLPAFPRRIAIVSSPRGAAIRDVISVLSRRFPLFEVDLFPSLVQGADAPAALCAELDRIAALNRHDLVLLTRGGGSIEDLSAFNDETLARRIAAMPMPVVSAIGHEIDFTIADFVADLRAPTPSAAAELIAPSSDAIRDRIESLLQRLRGALHRRLERDGQRLDRLQLRLAARDPLAQLTRIRDRLRQAATRLFRAPVLRLMQCRQRLEWLHARLRQDTVLIRRDALAKRVEQARERLTAAISHRLQHDRIRLEGLVRSLHALDPVAILSRGYAIVLDVHGRTVQSVLPHAAGDRLRIRVQDGVIDVEVIATHHSG